MLKKLNLIIDPELKTRILTFVDKKEYFVKNRANRRYCNLNLINSELSKDVKNFAKECFNKYKIDVIEERYYGNFIGVNTEGGFVHKHKDPRDAYSNIHVRLNFLLSKPEKGGNIIINDIEYELQENDSWLNLASEWAHESTKVVGTKPRVVLSLGSYVNIDKINNLIGTI